MRKSVTNPVAAADFIVEVRDSRRFQDLEVALDRFAGAAQLLGQGIEVPARIAFLDQAEESERPTQSLTLSDSAFCIGTSLGHRFCQPNN